MAKSTKEIRKDYGVLLAVKHLSDRLDDFRFENEKTRRTWTKEDKIALNVLVSHYKELEPAQGEESNCSECGALVRYHGRSWFHIVDLEKDVSDALRCSKSDQRRSKP